MISSSSAVISGASHTSVVTAANNINKAYGSTANPIATTAGRGVPPPIPPNKPIIPPKREPSATRLLASGAANTATAISSNSVASANSQIVNAIVANNILASKQTDASVPAEDSQ